MLLMKNIEKRVKNMIGVSKLLCDTENFGDSLRYAPGVHGQRHGAAQGMGPVLSWNITRTCNLRCVHCYSDSDGKKYDGELTTKEAKKFIDDCAAFKVPVLLLSGGEPLIRPDVFELVEHAKKYGIRSTFSTNGTLIDKQLAKDIKALNVGYVGISLDGLGEANDKFRGKQGAFEKALEGIRNCLDVGQRVGLRFTINRYNFHDLENIFRLIKEEKIPRVCFYHLVYSGRASQMMEHDVTHEESRQAMDLIMAKAQELDKTCEILTVDNHADIVYLYLQALKKDPVRAEKVWNLMMRNGGNRSGIAFGNVDPLGNVHSDQFTQNYTFGNVRDRAIGDIWTDESNPILAGLKDRKALLKGRCGICKWLNVCNGNFRARAEAATGDFWESDPACYLTDEEIGIVK
ncbi:MULTISPECIES: putative heme d1 biosynthesis radical SAM protein NirJ1 [Pelosinus]|uniref:Mycofactocin maturase MftC n=1 Tax=Pelosinus fermentans B4 TaxID=1149862 RepID=I8RE96_9FIRM|nr:MULTISPECIES: putative heme d1 biosynthesis radical SAM protein NirJ1 [Pelosinus]EIW15850.1 Putative heme d1 biosynthesis protein, NirJ1 [Pelosinus fermentans B4]EIW27444.1 Radical SAM domain protein [Pelosinus fermentans A11]OAM92599.1 putative heme d1 biosynthesis protein, NirJ1 [Pelosinus fermentans DSM 17108]SDQ50394.1 putative heme d1 biosynthesis radical SAM protein NirJ1 [Pelosinus fermentans]